MEPAAVTTNRSWDVGSTVVMGGVHVAATTSNMMKTMMDWWAMDMGVTWTPMGEGNKRRKKSNN